MPYQSHGKTYCRLVIRATDPQTEIWIGCDQGHFVVKETGNLDTGLLPGNYFAEFGLGTGCYKIDLNTDCDLTQAELQATGTCPRPNTVLLDDPGNSETNESN